MTIAQSARVRAEAQVRLAFDVERPEDVDHGDRARPGLAPLGRLLTATDSLFYLAAGGQLDGPALDHESADWLPRNPSIPVLPESSSESLRRMNKFKPYSRNTGRTLRLHVVAEAQRSGRLEGFDATRELSALASLDSAVIKSISYNSPLEMVIGFSASAAAIATSAAVVASRVRKIFEAYQDIRVSQVSTKAQIRVLRAVQSVFDEVDSSERPHLTEDLKSIADAAEVLKVLRDVQITQPG